MKHYNIWLTNDCTLNCKYCYENMESNRRYNMKEDIAFKVLCFIRKQKDLVESVNFHGGEPLINYEIMEYFVVELYKINPNIKFSFTTNGTVWNTQICNLLHKYKGSFESGITLSIDGNKNVHNLNRKFKNGQGSYDIAVETLNKLKSIFKYIRGRMTVTPDTASSIYESVVHLYALHITTITHAFNCFSDQWNDDHIELIKREYAKVICFWNNDRSINISFADGLGIRKKMGNCSININIGIDGKIYPCLYTVNNEVYVIGDITDGVTQDKIDYYKNNILCNDNDFCKECTNKDFCASNRCKFKNKVITGDYYLPSGIACALENLENSLYIKYRDFLNNQLT